MRLHWDSLVADVDLSATQAAAHHGLLQRGNSQLRFDGSTALTNYKFTDSSRFTATLDLSDATVSELQSLAGYSYPLDGVVNMHARIAGTRNDLSGASEIRISNGTAYGETFQSLNADVLLARQDYSSRTSPSCRQRVGRRSSVMALITCRAGPIASI